jgi:dihydroorotase
MSVIPKEITFNCLADPHVHLRQGDVVADLLRYSIEGGADIVGAMPNTHPTGLTTTEAVIEYLATAKRLRPPRSVGNLGIFPFIMITEHTTLDEIEHAAASGIKNGKFYPKDRTTNSKDGIRDYLNVFAQVKKCGEVGIMCHFHPEYPWLEIIGRDAEYQFIGIVEMFLRNTEARIVWEHGTDGRCVPLWEQFAKDYPNRFFVTVTAHHLAFDEDMAHGNVAMTCKPPIKSKVDRWALIELVAKNHSWVMLGSDSAYHPKHSKHVDKGACACGDFVAPFLAPLCAHALGNVLARSGGLEVFENFVSGNARQVHNLLPASRRVSLINEEFTIPLTYDVNGEQALPPKGGETIDWRFADAA